MINGGDRGIGGWGFPVCATATAGAALCHTCKLIVVQSIDTMEHALTLARESLQVLGTGRQRVDWIDWIAHMRQRLDECGAREDLMTIRDWEECRMKAQGSRWLRVWAPRTMFVRRRFVCVTCRLAEVNRDPGHTLANVVDRPWSTTSALSGDPFNLEHKSEEDMEDRGFRGVLA